MILEKNAYIEIIVNGYPLELTSQDGLNLRINNIVLDPEKSTTTQAEYSFEFEIPASDNNNRIFNYGNNLAVLNKFHSRYNAEVYSDGMLIFSGSITVNQYNKGYYTCNLVSVKMNSVEEIFGDTTLNAVDWRVDYDGIPTINEVNADPSTKYYFPLTSYGVFIKRPYIEDEISNEYTSKYLLDEYNKWYYTTFWPSLNMLETMRKCFEKKGYKVYGNAFDDRVLSNIYMSTNLEDEQAPAYNYGNPHLGKVSLDIHWGNGTSINNRYMTYEENELKFPYYGNSFFAGSNLIDATGNDGWYNWTYIDVYDMLDSGNTNVSVTKEDKSYLWSNNDSVIIIPADGFYKIDLDVDVSLLAGDGGIKADEIGMVDGQIKYVTMSQTQPLSLKEVSPIEIQLVRNYEDNLELIFGKNKKTYINNSTGKRTIDIVTCFPHQELGGEMCPTRPNDLKTTSRFGSRDGSSSNKSASQPVDESAASTSGNFGGYRGNASTPATSLGGNKPNSYGFVYADTWSLCYDPVVNDNFICGFSSLYDGCSAVRKNGYSWSKLYSTKTDNFYGELGYVERLRNSDGSITESDTRLNENGYINCPAAYCNVTDNTMKGHISCCIWLNRNDVISLKVIMRHYENMAGGESQRYYYATADSHLTIEAFSPHNYDYLKSIPITYYSPTQFDDKLQLGNFLSSGKTMVDFVEDMMKSFNLEITENGNTINIDKKKVFLNSKNAVVDINDRVNPDNISSSKINYPSTIAIKYKIDTSEWGFEQTVPADHINDIDWEDYGDYGFSVVKLNDDSWITTKEETNLDNSYTYYQNFTWESVDENGVADTAITANLNIPVISKADYMIDRYNYDEAMKVDGCGLPLRFWFRQSPSEYDVWTVYDPKEYVTLALPINVYEGVNLSYKNTEKSLLTEYFNITPYLESNYINFDVYLKPEEYNLLRNGCSFKVDDDIYLTCEISGYDPSGSNPTELKGLKKV